MAFIKTLKRPADIRARKRFVREATAYETLEPLGIPRLLEHNADEWKQRGTPLYLALEYIPGATLTQLVQNRGPLDLDTSIECISVVASTLGRCHADGVLHRDIKPSNIVCKDNATSVPYIVDFGLSFNSATPSDITGINEEIGNRFLRLPEHALGVRNAASDITQLAGVLLFLLTGIAPQVLLDEEGTPPHQRSAADTRLASVVAGRPLRQLLSLFDRSFATPIKNRFATIEEFQLALDAVSGDEDEGASLESLLARMSEALMEPNNAESNADYTRLTAILRAITSIASRLASERGVQLQQSGQTVDVDEFPRRGRTHLSLALSSERPVGIEFVFEVRSQDLALLISDTEIWRGRNVDDDLERVVKTALVSKFLERYGR